MQLMEKRQLAPLGNVGNKILDVLTPIIEKESASMDLHMIAPSLQKALSAYRSAASSVVANASALIDKAATASTSVVEAMKSRMWPTMSGGAAAGSGGLSTTDTVSNIPVPPAAVSEGHSSLNKQPLPAAVSEGHSSHNKQPRPPPPPPPQQQNKPSQQQMEEAMSEVSSPRDPETDDASDGSSEEMTDDDGVSKVQYKDYMRREGNASQTRKNYEREQALSKAPRTPEAPQVMRGRFRPKPNLLRIRQSRREIVQTTTAATFHLGRKETMQVRRNTCFHRYALETTRKSSTNLSSICELKVNRSMP